VCSAGSTPAQSNTMRGLACVALAWPVSAITGTGRNKRGAEAMSPQELVFTGWHYEDELPKGYPYELEFHRSRIVDGVRMFPPHVCDWQRSWDGGTEICKCGAWR
jgi:hypothetical protein